MKNGQLWKSIDLHEWHTPVLDMKGPYRSMHCVSEHVEMFLALYGGNSTTEVHLPLDDKKLDVLSRLMATKCPNVKRVSLLLLDDMILLPLKHDITHLSLATSVECKSYFLLTKSSIKFFDEDSSLTAHFTELSSLSMTRMDINVCAGSLLGKSKKIKSIFLDHCTLEGAFKELLGELPNLDCLVMDKCFFYVRCADDFASVLKLCTSTCKRLKQLHVEKFMVKEWCFSDVLTVESMLQPDLPCLTSLTLSCEYITITEQDAKFISKYFPNLEELDTMNSKGVKDGIISIIATGLMKLKKLMMNLNDVTDSGFQCLLRHENLCQLDVSFSRKLSCDVLVATLSTLPAVTKVFVSSLTCNMSQEDRSVADLITHTKPDVQVVVRDL